MRGRRPYDEGQAHKPGANAGANAGASAGPVRTLETLVAALLIATMMGALAWAALHDNDGRVGPKQGGVEVARHLHGSEQGSQVCVRFGGCSKLRNGDHRLTAIDTWGDGRKIIAAAKCGGRLWTVADQDGKGGGYGIRHIPCNGKWHETWRKDPNGSGPTLWKASEISYHPG